MAAWFDWYPERYQQELDAYERNDVEILEDVDAKAQGKLVLSLSLHYREKEFQVRVEYPDLFPYFCPEAFLDNATLVRHQSPTNGNLCILGRGTDQWNVDDCFADIFLEQFHRIVDFDLDRDEAQIRSVEEPQGEPVSDYFNGQGLSRTCIVYDTAWCMPDDVHRGCLKLKFDLEETGQPPAVGYHGYISSIMDDKGKVLVEWEGPKFSYASKTIIVPWVRLEKPPSGILDEIKGLLSDDDRKFVNFDRPKDGGVSLFGLLFREEVKQFEYADGWAFIENIFLRKKRPETSPITTTVRTFRAGNIDLSARMPGTEELAQKKVAIVGLGALGSAIATELARAGIGELALADFDYVEPATVRRWSIGVPAFGIFKGEALSERIEEEYPWTSVSQLKMKVGGNDRVHDNRTQYDEVVDLIAESDLVIDATTEVGVNHFLSTMCREMGKAYLVGSATPGAWGGYVAQFDPDHPAACWVCLSHDLNGAPPADDLPASDPQGMLQPAGCAARTFTGTGYDLKEVSLELVRMATGLLTDEDGYPRTPWQLGILNMRSDEGERKLPTWHSREIVRRNDCECSAH